VRIHPVVAFEEAAEEQAVDVLRLRVGGEARVEIGGIGLDQDGEGARIGVCAVRTCCEEKGSNEVKK
jgi:hypothetical protein